MNKQLALWVWISSGLAAILVSLAFLIVGAATEAFTTPISELSPVYWVAVSFLVVALALLLVVLFRFSFSQQSQAVASETTVWFVIASNVFMVVLFTGLLLIDILLQPNAGGIQVFHAVMLIFALAVTGINLGKLIKVRNAR